MIVIPENTEISKEFRERIEFFNSLEENLEWPICEGRAEARQLLKLAETQYKTLFGLK